jgi:hypothetical protein
MRRDAAVASRFYDGTSPAIAEHSEAHDNQGVFQGSTDQTIPLDCACRYRDAKNGTRGTRRASSNSDARTNTSSLSSRRRLRIRPTFGDLEQRDDRRQLGLH